MRPLVIGDARLSVRRVAEAAKTGARVEISPTALARLETARAVVDQIVAEGTAVYGANTGVGSQKDHAVPPSDVLRYNRELIYAHGTRVPGPTASDDWVRATLILMINEHCHGYSGISPALVQLLADKTNEGDLPPIDVNGSVGASDLVPLAQISQWMLSDPRLEAAKLPGVKDALSLINCNAFSLAKAALCAHDLRQLLSAFQLSAAFSLEGFRANLDASSQQVAQATTRLGQNTVSKSLAKLLAGSRLLDPSAARFLQDPLSFRNITQVLGAVQECADWLERVIEDEMASSAVNPMIDAEAKRARSHGNMDTTRLTLALDMMRQALAKAADLAGERLHKQQWPAFSGLPIGLAEAGSARGGVQYLNLGHIAASEITSVKSWATPYLLHSVGQVADGVEDTASHAVHAVCDLSRQIDAGFTIATLEAVIAIWAIDRRGLRAHDLGAALSPIFDRLRPALPVGQEGQIVFDIKPLVHLMRQEAQALAFDE